MSGQSADGIDRTADESNLPAPEKVADELARISRDLDHELKDREHAYLNAADHYLRYIVAEIDRRGGGEGR